MVSPALLISDLGVPRRFLHMLHLFKVTSPMSVGSWILAAFGASTAPAALNSFGGGRLGAAGRGAQVASALLGLPLSSYTAALIADTAVPAWHEARRELPFLFAAGAAATAHARRARPQPRGCARSGSGGALSALASSSAASRVASTRSKCCSARQLWKVAIATIAGMIQTPKRQNQICAS